MKIFPVSDLNIPELALYNERAETGLYRYYEPEPGLFIAETPMVIERALDAGYEPVSMLGEEKLLRSREDLLERLPEDVPVYSGTGEVLSEIAGYRLARGLLCMMRRRPLPPATEVEQGTSKFPETVQGACKAGQAASRLVILDRVMNPTNVGAIFRSAAALGMDGILLTKGCSDPLYRRAARVSMGNVFLIPWTYIDERIPTHEYINGLKERGFLTAAMTLSEDTVSLGSRDFSGVEKLAVVMGSESEGVSEETAAACDVRVMIPMARGVDSLNVAAASAVAFWEMRKA